LPNAPLPSSHSAPFGRRQMRISSAGISQSLQGSTGSSIAPLPVRPLVDAPLPPRSTGANLGPALGAPSAPASAHSPGDAPSAPAAPASASAARRSPSALPADGAAGRKPPARRSAACCARLACSALRGVQWTLNAEAAWAACALLPARTGARPGREPALARAATLPPAGCVHMDGDPAERAPALRSQAGAPASGVGCPRQMQGPEQRPCAVHGTHATVAARACVWGPRRGAHSGCARWRRPGRRSQSGRPRRPCPAAVLCC